MTSVCVTALLDSSVHEAETCWYDTTRWPAWVDSLARVIAVEGDWPGVGASVTWESGPAGRGRVRERVIAFKPLSDQTVQVDDDSIEGRQRVAFEPVERGVQVELALDYRIKRRSPVTPLVDRLFVRRQMSLSLSRTLHRFADVLETSRASGLG